MNDLNKLSKAQLIQTINDLKLKYESRHTVKVYIDVIALDEEDAAQQVSVLLNDACPDLSWSF